MVLKSAMLFVCKQNVKLSISFSLFHSFVYSCIAHYLAKNESKKSSKRTIYESLAAQLLTHTGKTLEQN